MELVSEKTEFPFARDLVRNFFYTIEEKVENIFWLRSTVLGKEKCSCHITKYWGKIVLLSVFYILVLELSAQCRLWLPIVISVS